MVVSVGLIYLFGSIVPAELAPLEDRSEFRFQATATEGATFEYMDAYVEEMEDFINEEVPEELTTFSMTGRGSTNTGFLSVRLVPPSERKRTQQEIVDDLSAKTKKFTGIRTYVSQSPTIGDRRGGFPVQFVLQASEIEKLKEVIPTFLDRANESPLFTYVDVDLKFTKPEINILINRDKARSLGVNIVDISQTLQ
jgi:multidrug efflux pump